MQYCNHHSFELLVYFTKKRCHQWPAIRSWSHGLEYNPPPPQLINKYTKCQLPPLEAMLADQPVFGRKFNAYCIFRHFMYQSEDAKLFDREPLLVSPWPQGEGRTHFFWEGEMDTSGLREMQSFIIIIIIIDILLWYWIYLHLQCLTNLLACHKKKKTQIFKKLLKSLNKILIFIPKSELANWTWRKSEFKHNVQSHNLFFVFSNANKWNLAS